MAVREWSQSSGETQSSLHWSEGSRGTHTFCWSVCARVRRVHTRVCVGVRRPTLSVCIIVSIPLNSLLNATFKHCKHHSVEVKHCVCVSANMPVYVTNPQQGEMICNSLSLSLSVARFNKAELRDDARGWGRFKAGLNWNSFSISLLKGHYTVLGKTFKPNKSNEAITQTLFFCYLINRLFSEENKVRRALFEARKVAGSATCKQSKTDGNCVV